MKKYIVLICLFLAAPVFADEIIDKITFAVDGSPFQVFGRAGISDLAPKKRYVNALSLLCLSDTDNLYNRLDQDAFKINSTRESATPHVVLNEADSPLTGDITCTLKILSDSPSLSIFNVKLTRWPPQ